MAWQCHRAWLLQLKKVMEQLGPDPKMSFSETVPAAVELYMERHPPTGNRGYLARLLEHVTEECGCSEGTVRIYQ